MKLLKLSLILTIFLTASCKKERPMHVWVYDNRNVTILNGNVKQVSIKYHSEPVDFFYHIFFDEQGNLTQSQRKTLDIAQIEDKVDSTISTENIKYSLNISNTQKIAITGSYSCNSYNSNKTNSKYAYMSKWELDKNGHAVSYVQNIQSPSSDMGTYKYDTTGNLIEYDQKEFSHSEDRISCKYKYDHYHQIIESDFYDVGLLLKVTTFEYKSFDSNKNWTVQISHSINRGPWAQAAPVATSDTLNRKITYY